MAGLTAGFASLNLDQEFTAPACDDSEFRYVPFMRPYRKQSSAELLTIGEDSMIVCDGLSEAFALDSEDLLVWEALDQRGDFDLLVEVLKEERPEKSDEVCRQTLRSLLDRLVMAGLLEFTISGQLHKCDDAFSETAGGELLVWLGSRRKVHVFNETSAVLWDALDTFRDLGSLSALAVDAWQDRDPIESQRYVAVFVATLFDAGLVRMSNQQSPGRT